MYSSYSFSTSALDKGKWPPFTPGESTPIHIVQEAGWVPEPVWKQRLEEKYFCLCRGPNLDRPIVQPVARRNITKIFVVSCVRFLSPVQKNVKKVLKHLNTEQGPPWTEVWTRFVLPWRGFHSSSSRARIHPVRVQNWELQNAEIAMSSSTCHGIL
jgi:hypothetical protein